MRHAGGIQGELEGHHPAVGVADDLRPVQAELAQHRSGIRGLVGDGARHRRTGATREAPAVIREEAVPPRERRLHPQQDEGVRDGGAMDEQNGLTASLGRDVKGYPVDPHLVHDRCSFTTARDATSGRSHSIRWPPVGPSEPVYSSGCRQAARG